MQYAITLGDKQVTVDAENRDEAVSKLKEQMTQEGIDAHYGDAEGKPSVEEAHASIDSDTAEVASEEAAEASAE